MGESYLLLFILTMDTCMDAGVRKHREHVFENTKNTDKTIKSIKSDPIDPHTNGNGIIINFTHLGEVYNYASPIA